jgi:hypothetical protein
MTDLAIRHRNQIDFPPRYNVPFVLLFKLQEFLIYASCIPTSTSNSDPLRTSVLDKSRRDKEVIKKYMIAIAFWGTRQLLDQVKDYSLSLVPSISCFNRSTELPRDFDAYRPILFARNMPVP